MRWLGLPLIVLALSGCAIEKRATRDVDSQNVRPPFSSTPVSVLKPVSPKVSLTSKQREYLNDTLPPDIRKILEASETLEILAEMGPAETSETELQEFRPNRIVTITDENQKRQILESFYTDAATEDGPASCYEPHHGLRVSTGGKIFEIEICFSCAQFQGVGDLRTVSGTIVRNGRKSEELFNKLVMNQSIELKQ